MQYGIITDANFYTGQLDAWRTAVRDMKAHGLTFAMSPTGSLATLSAMLTICDEEQGFTLYCAPAYELDKEWWPSWQANTLAQARDAVVTFCQPLMGYQSLGGWYLYDEPRVADSAGLAERIRTLTLALRESDQRPVFSTIASEADGAELLLQTCPDAAVPFWYPCTVGLPEQTATDMAAEPFLADALTARPSHMPLWLIVQAHSGTTFNLRPPSCPELRAQIANAERLGAEKVIFFAYESQEGGFTGLKDRPELWAEIAAITGGSAPPPPPPPPPSGTGVPRPAIQGDIEQWWANHPLKQPMVIAPTAETEVINLSPGVHVLGDIIGAGNRHFIGGPGVVVDIASGMRIGPSDFSFRYHDGLTVSLHNGEQSTIELLTTGRLKNVYFKDITFDHGHTANGISLAACDGVMFDNCKFINGQYSGTFHLGHINGNACLDHIVFRNCEFTGGFRVPVYLDGAHAAVFKDCTISGHYGSTGFLFLNNNDVTFDYDGDSVVEKLEQRMAQYIVVSGCQSTQYLYSIAEVTGGPFLVENSSAPVTAMAYQARKSNATVVYDQRGVVVRNNTFSGPLALEVQPHEDTGAGSVQTLVGDFRVSGNSTNAISVP